MLFVNYILCKVEDKVYSCEPSCGQCQLFVVAIPCGSNISGCGQVYLFKHRMLKPESDEQTGKAI